MNGFRSEFEDIALPLINVIYRAALRLTKSESDADDLVQDTYLRAYRYFDRFERGTSIRAWLLTILRNIFLNELGKRARNPEFVSFEQLILSGEEPADSGDPEEELLSKLIGDQLMDAMNAVPEKFREVILLSDLQGFSYKEIAGIIDRPIGIVMSRLYRGRMLLRNSLRKYAADFVCLGRRERCDDVS